MALDKDYVVKDGEIVIVDTFTGRMMPGRRYSDGLHQAIEAKEHVEVQRESKTLATITFQNFFNKYTKKSGMTGTAQTEEQRNSVQSTVWMLFVFQLTDLFREKTFQILFTRQKMRSSELL